MVVVTSLPGCKQELYFYLSYVAASAGAQDQKDKVLLRDTWNIEDSN